MTEQDNQQDEQEQIRQRRSKLNDLRDSGGIAFPTDFRRNVVAGELLAEYGEKSKEELEAGPLRVKIAGRMDDPSGNGQGELCPHSRHVGQDTVVCDAGCPARRLL